MVGWGRRILSFACPLCFCFGVLSVDMSKLQNQAMAEVFEQLSE
jgi:hypothetical protein